MYKSVKELASTLRVFLRNRDFDINENSKDDILISEYEVERAISEINKCRRLTPTEKKPYDKKYEDLIIPLCLCSYAKIGAEGQSSHSENGINRTYTTGGDYPIDVLNGIIPLVK